MERTVAISPAGAHMTLAYMLENGVRSVTAACEACQREAVVICDTFPDILPVPDQALRLRFSECGSREITTRPDWTERPRVIQ